MGRCFNVTFYCRCKLFDRARLRVRVGALLLAEGWDDIDESSVVLHSSLSSSSLGLLLLLGVDLRGLSLDLTSSGKIRGLYHQAFVGLLRPGSLRSNRIPQGRNR